MKQAVLVMLFAIIVGELIGLRGVHATSTIPSQKTAPKVDIGVGPGGDPYAQAFDAKSTNLRLMLQNLLKEHTILTVLYLTSLYDGKDASALEDLLNTNTEDLADVVQAVYGNTARDEFVRQWKQHITEYKNYTLAKRSNNTVRMKTAGTNLKVLADKFGSMVDQVSNNLSAKAIKDQVQMHFEGTLSLVDAHAAGDQARKADLMKKGYDQAGEFADMLTIGIIKDKPDMFR